MHAPLWVKIGMSIGFSILGIFAIDTVGNIVFPDGEEAHHGAEDVAGAHEVVEPASDFDLAAALASIQPDEGAVKKCAACHTFEEGGEHKIGPNLWGTVGLAKASHEGFSYSSSLENLGGTWTYEDLFHFLSNPKKFAPGTKMTFAGFKKEQDAAEAVAYLRTLSANPEPLPEPSAATEETHDEAVATDEGTETAEGETDAATSDEGADETAVEESTDEATSEEATSDEAAASEESGSRFASADVSKGERAFKKCLTCHTPEQGGANKIGPNLWNIMTRGKGTHEGFNYSSEMASAGGQWTVEDLDHFLENPKGFMPGTKMTFAGLKKESDRTNVIAYLATLDDNPVELE